MEALMRLAGRLTAVILLLAAATAAAGDSRKKVLLVFDEDKDLAGLALINRTLQETLSQATHDHVTFFTESLNLSQFPRPDYDDILRDTFQRKYAGTHIDLIVAVMQPSVAFLLRHRDAIFPGVPIVFCGLDPSQEQEVAGYPDVTGVVIKRTFGPTLDIALRLQPDTTNVFVTGGTSAFDRQVQAIARPEFEAFRNRVSMTWLTDLTMTELLTKVSHLPEHSVIVHLTLFTDAAASAFVPHESVASIAARANAPVYVALDQYLDRGVVGGHVYSFAKHARQAAEAGARVLRGERASSIPVVESAAYADMFDWRQLRRWNLDESRLPPGSIVLFGTLSLWDTYKSYIAGGIAIVVLETALILALLANRAQLRRAHAAARESELRRLDAEREVQRERNELAHALRLTTLGELTASIAHDLGQPLAAILANTEALHRLASAHALTDSELQEAMADIEMDARRAGEVLSLLRDLFRKESSERARVDVNAIVDDVLRMLRSDLQSKKIWVRFTRAYALPGVLADPVQVRQVILNVIVNAEEAITAAAGSERDIHIESRREGEHVAITVRDTGIGTAESDLAHMFDRYVTTKPEGLGMGLAISRSIVQAHRGRIWATRNEDRGLTLHIELPVDATTVMDDEETSATA
jgi:signal transduction histidine kinase